MEAAIQVRGLRKSYKDLEVLKGVDLDVARGSILALLGSNGAGKTTLVRILATLLKADSGTATVSGLDVAAQPAKVREAISLTGQFAAVDEILTGRENLVMIAGLRRVKGAAKVADGLLARFGLADAAGRRVATYSGGMRRRLDIAMSLIGDPRVVFLDEPTTGLDPEGRLEVWQVIQDLASGGTTVLLTTQYLDEAERLADRIAILHGGTIITSGTLAELRKLLPPAKAEYVERQPTLEEIFLAITGSGRKSAPHFFGDTAVMLKRSLRHILRSPDTIITTAIMPIAFMLLFRYVFGGAIKAGTSNYVNYLMPGILLIAIASGISYTAYRLFQDMQGGIFERFHSMPITRSSVLWGHVLTSLVANAISVVVIIAVGLIMGFRSSAGVLPWLAVAGMLILFTLTLTWLALIAGLTAKSTDGASAFSYPLVFLPLISSAFVPTATMPGPVRAFAENQPVTSIVNAIRDLLAQQPAGNAIWIALAWCAGVLLVAYTFAMLAYRRKIA